MAAGGAEKDYHLTDLIAHNSYYVKLTIDRRFLKWHVQLAVNLLRLR